MLGLLERARAIVCPSIYEGFGLPAIEALACGVRVVAARRAAFPEICGANAILVDPTPSGLSEGIIEALAEPDGEPFGADSAAQFSWADVARARIALYRALES